jgi:hypothetical protein
MDATVGVSGTVVGLENQNIQDELLGENALGKELNSLLAQVDPGMYQNI